MKWRTIYLSHRIRLHNSLSEEAVPQKTSATLLDSDSTELGKGFLLSQCPPTALRFKWRWYIVPFVLDGERRGILTPSIRTSRWSQHPPREGTIFIHSEGGQKTAHSFWTSVPKTETAGSVGRLIIKGDFLASSSFPWASWLTVSQQHRHRVFPGNGKASILGVPVTEPQRVERGWQKNLGFLTGGGLGGARFKEDQKAVIRW